MAPETWPPRHRVHKYWGRKPANVVARYIEYFAHPGEIVLDPFAGSAVTLVEGARLGRRAIGYDLNPFAVRLGQALLNPPAAEDFGRASKALVDGLRPEMARWFGTACRACGGRAQARSYAYDGPRMIEVRYRCDTCGHLDAATPTSADLELAQTSAEPPAGTPDDDVYPGWEMRKLRKRSVRRWSELFTPRNLRLAGLLHQGIAQIPDDAIRSWLKLTLTASLAQLTRMIADFSGRAGGPSWKINCFWLPERWQELNPLWYFANRVRKSTAAIVDLCRSGAPFDTRATYTGHDSRRLPLSDSAVDYVFTDPPYGGEGVQYGELSALWCLWLDEPLRLNGEIAFNPLRNLSEDDYARGIRQVFSEVYRVLKPRRWMTVTFANKSPAVWDGLLDACRDAGFRLVTASPMRRSAPALTETTMRRAPKADLILSFQRPLRIPVSAPRAASRAPYNLGQRVRSLVGKLRAANRVVIPSEVFDLVTIDWFSWFYETGHRPASVCPTLEVVERELGRLPAAATRGAQVGLDGVARESKAE